jgi:hypothetical protein
MNWDRCHEQACIRECEDGCCQKMYDTIQRVEELLESNTFEAISGARRFTVVSAYDLRCALNPAHTHRGDGNGRGGVGLYILDTKTGRFNVKINKLQFMLWEWTVWDGNEYIVSGVTSFERTAVRAAHKKVQELQ